MLFVYFFFSTLWHGNEADTIINNFFFTITNGRTARSRHVYNKYILLDVLMCSIAVYFYELCSILTSP